MNFIIKIIYKWCKCRFWNQISKVWNWMIFFLSKIWTLIVLPLKIPQKPHFLVTKSWFQRPPSSWLLVKTPQTSFEIYLSQLVVGYPATMGWSQFWRIILISLRNFFKFVFVLKFSMQAKISFQSFVSLLINLNFRKSFGLQTQDV